MLGREPVAVRHSGCRGGALTMSVRIEMPQLSSEGESATLASWLVDVGDSVEAGEVIAELETDKSTVELEAPAGGTIVELSVAAGTEDVAPGSLLGRIDSPDAVAPAGEASAPIAETDAPEVTAPEAADEPPAQASAKPSETAVATNAAAAAGTPSADGSERRATPLARRVAASKGVDLGSVAGSGPGGRVVEADVLRVVEGSEALSESPAADGPVVEALVDVPDGEGGGGAGFETRRLSAMRKTIARRLTESKQQVPHFYLRVRVRMDELIAVRTRLNAGLAAEGREVKISLNDFIVRASALALRDVPAANVQFAGDSMRFFDRVDVSVAVATDGGLVTPLLRDADRLGLVALSSEVRSLAGLAREGRLKPEQYQGGTFTVSNLGMYGIETVYPILNPPQACILGVGAADEQPVVRDGEIVVGQIAALTLAADHRAVDGAVGAQLLAAIRDRLEDPMGMML